MINHHQSIHGQVVANQQHWTFVKHYGDSCFENKKDLACGFRRNADVIDCLCLHSDSYAGNDRQCFSSSCR